MKRVLYFALAPALCLVVFWDVLFTWFLNDDFAWLGIGMELHRAGDFFTLLFRPQAQGTIRFLSERLFFLLGTALFGIHAVPFRVVGLATWFLVLALASVIGARLTGSRAAGLLAAVFWTTSYALVSPLAWSSAYNQLLCSLLMLCAFYARLRWLESKNTRWLMAEWAAYLLGFGALEITVMYPFAAAGYTWAVAREREKSVFALFLPAAAFTALHFLLIPKHPADIYTLHFDSHILTTIVIYLLWAFGPSRFQELNVPEWNTAGLMATRVICVALAAFAVWRLRKGDRVPVFGLAWFGLFLLPVLPLSNHITDYYLTLPLAGAAWVAGWAVVNSWKSNIAWRVASLLLAAVFFAGSIYEISLSTIWFRSRGARMRALYRAMEQAAPSHPGSAFLLQNVDNALFQSGFEDNPFRLIGVSRVYLAPGTEGKVEARPDLGGIARFTIAPEEALRLLDRKELVVLDVAGSTPTDTTAGFAATLGTEIAHSSRNFVDVGSSLYASKLGPEWYQVENGFRWMPKRATVMLAGPKSTAERLYVTGFGAAPALASGPVALTLRASGKELGSAEVKEPNQPFALNFALPAGLADQSVVPITIEASKTFHPAGDPRELGLIFGTFEIK
jgi:hypothetical protein